MTSSLSPSDEPPILTPLLLLTNHHPPSSAINQALTTLHSALPTASKIYITIHRNAPGPYFRTLQTLISDPSLIFNPPSTVSNHSDDHDDHELITPEIILLPIEQGLHTFPASELLAAHARLPDSTFFALSTDFPFLSAPALQQLVLEYQPPVTCFVHESVVPEPLIAIWSPDALRKLGEKVENGGEGLQEVIRELNGKLVRPLRDIWIERKGREEERARGKEGI